MSLDYSFMNVRTDLPLDSDERKEWFGAQWDTGRLESLIFNTMTIGIGHIKDEATAEKFYHRYVMYYLSQGYDLFYDLAFVKSMIGLRTNASPISDAQFSKQLYSNLSARADRKLSMEKEA